MREFNVGQTITFDYTDSEGKVTTNRQTTIEVARSYKDTTLITGFTLNDGAKQYRSFKANKMTNVRV